MGSPEFESTLMSVRKLQLLRLWEADTKADLALSQATPDSMLPNEKLPGSVLLNQRIFPHKKQSCKDNVYSSFSMYWDQCWCCGEEDKRGKVSSKALYIAQLRRTSLSPSH